MIRTAEKEDIEIIMEIYKKARAFMINQGNPNQWGNTHPAREMVKADIEKKQLYVWEQEGRICGVFAFIIGEDPTYKRIDEGSWQSEQIYGTIHRLAGDSAVKGVFSNCLTYCISRCSHLRADTHFDNHIMQHLLEKNGFEKRGIIYVQDHSPRIAYERI